jgi:arylsulfatase A-like enzyme
MHPDGMTMSSLRRRRPGSRGWRRRLWAVTLVASGLAVPASSSADAVSASARPNIVVVMTDDLGKDGFETLLQGGFLPAVKEHLVDKGVTFANSFVTNPECCPSRATFLTGLYAHNHRVFSNLSPDPGKAGIAWPGWLAHDGQPGREGNTLATWLHGAGYRTGFVGKYLNGYGDVAPPEVSDPRTYVPPGWDDWNALVGITTYSVFNFDLNENGTVVRYGDAEADYQTDVLAARAVDFVHRASAAPEPFFLFVGTSAPHVEVLDPLGVLNGTGPGFRARIRPAPRHAHWIDGDQGNGELQVPAPKPSFNEADLTDKPSCPAAPPPPGIVYVTVPFCTAELPLIPEDLLPDADQLYKSMLASMLAVDDLVGDLVAELDAAGVLSNTVIVFTSDNGWLNGEHRALGKGVAYEESIRVPLVIRAPSGREGAQASAIALNNDLAPTLAQLAGVAPPYDPDGASLVPVLQNPATTGWHRRAFLVERWFIPSFFRAEPPTYFALRRIHSGLNYLYTSTWANPRWPAATHHEFYNLLSDPYQLSSIPLPQASYDAVDNYLVAFRTCRGQACRDLESN